MSVSPYQWSQRTDRRTVGADARATEFDFSHPRVDDFVARFTGDLRGFYSNALSRSGRYVPRMSSILEKEGLPQELAYLPLIESGFRTHAVSRAGAVGPWQLIPGTGRRYGLRIDRYVDERRDPVKSTQAAAKYLKDLYHMFGDWHLSLAAYNTGEGNITRILEKGRAEDFWEMSDRGYLYQETEDFVPEFLAALQIAETPEAYGFEAPDEDAPGYDLVKVKGTLSLLTVAQLTGASKREIEELNPALHRGIVPPQGYVVRVPKGTKDAFEVALANLPRTVPSHGKRALKARRGKAVHRKIAVHSRKAVASLHAPTRVARNAGRTKLAKVGRTHKGTAGHTVRVASARRGAPSMVASRQKPRAHTLD